MVAMEDSLEADNELVLDVNSPGASPRRSSDVRTTDPKLRSVQSMPEHSDSG
jgi:hypothetical protein